MKCEIPEGYTLLSVVQTESYEMMTLILINEQKQTAEMDADLFEQKILDGKQKMIYGKNIVHYVLSEL